MGGRRKRNARRGRGLAVVLAAGGWAAACAGDLASVPGGFRHTRHRYQVASPALAGGAEVASWTRVEVEGADLAFRSAGGSLMSLRSRCKRPVAAPVIMARQLRIGLHVTKIHQSGPVAVLGVDGWMQRFDTRADEDAEPVAIKAVTLVADGCHYDFVLTARVGFGPEEADFDRFWQSFVQTPSRKSS